MRRPTLAGSALAFSAAFVLVPTDPRLIVTGFALYAVYAYARSRPRPA